MEPGCLQWAQSTLGDYPKGVATSLDVRRIFDNCGAIASLLVYGYVCVECDACSKALLCLLTGASFGPSGNDGKYALGWMVLIV